MIKLNLKPENEEQELLVKYLEENVSEILANKINNGVRIEKDGKPLTNKKDLKTFMDYASKKAKELAEKGKNYACVSHEKVFGWAIHYFEEDSIEGTLYNEDGTIFKAVATTTVKQEKTVTKTVKTTKKPDNQFTLFDIIPQESTEKTNDEEDIEEDDEEPTEEEIQDAMNELAKEKTEYQGSPIYQKYMEIQRQYPDCIIAYRLGDFYEIFGENAKKVANELNLTLTGRDCGLAERIPMVGFPAHVLDDYIAKIIEFGKIAIVEQSNVDVKEKAKQVAIDNETGEIINVSEDNDDLEEVAKSLDKEIMLKLYDLLDGELDIR